jgi:ATPase subunit of ABC transporter with duplicated ATPase domains
VLDEPTNHLDLESIQALVSALRAFEGTVIFVSHDRWFVSELATRILEVKRSGFDDFPGRYDEYLAQCGDDHLDVAAVVLRAKAELRAEPAGGKDDGSAWEDQKKKRNKRAALPAKRDKVLAQIEAAEARRKAIQDMYAQEGFFQRTLKGDLVLLDREDKELAAKIEAWLAEWEEIEKELASADAP